MQKIKGENLLLCCLVLFLCLFGMVMIYSASSYSSNILHGDSWHFVKKQVFGFLLGCVLMFIAYKFDYHKFYKLRYYIVAFSIVLLLLVFEVLRIQYHQHIFYWNKVSSLFHLR